MFKRRFLVPAAIVLPLFVLFCFERLYYRDRVEFLCPVEVNGLVLPIRCDSLGDGRFGAKRKNGRLHKGVDISAPIGTPVRAAKNGWAISGNHPNGYGVFVKIIHSGGLTTVYAHLKETNISWIKRVRQGDCIGAVGKSGNADHRFITPHLHFEVRKRGRPQDPMKGYLE